jgi:hypothetical protein
VGAKRPSRELGGLEISVRATGFIGLGTAEPVAVKEKLMVDRTKRETRARMARTGERYMTARQHVLRSQSAEAEAVEAFNVVKVGDLARNRADELSTEELIERFNEHLDSENNPWRLNLEELTLELEDGSYEVMLETCRTSAETLDWISQIVSKTWATDRILAGLMRVLDMLIDPQAHLCANGVEQGPVEWLPEDIEEAVRMSGTV